MAAQLNENKSVLKDDAVFGLLSKLTELGQGHLFESWPAPGSNDDDKRRLASQLSELNSQYPGGLESYIANAKKLLAESAKGANPYEGFTPKVPAGERLTFGSEEFHVAEEAGMGAIKGAAFVLVAGGLGERLGYNGIKVELPTELVTESCYLEYYCRYILALQKRAGDDNVQLPLCIMTSGDTHAKTVDLLERFNNFGMEEGQITIVKQEKVPALIDASGRFAVDEIDPFSVSTKPHGHGDVHTLIHMSGTAKKWASEGRKWAVFFQDTNGLVFRSVPAALGVSVRNSFALNSLTVPRKPGEAVGGICKLESNGDGGSSSVTINVEYNQLDPLLRSTVNPNGDVADDTGFSPYPGNINVLLFNIPTYASVLEETGGAIPEFVNPKYKEGSRTEFKKPTRLECMMQEFPKLFKPEHQVGFTQMERWMSFSAVKNNPKDALAKFNKTGFAESACAGEADFYRTNRKLLNSFGVNVVVEASTRNFLDIPTNIGAKVVLSPQFGVTVAELKGRFPSADCVSISSKSTLVLDGDITVESLELDGALIVRALEGAKVVIKKLKVDNKGWEFEDLPADTEHPEILRIRGYSLAKREQRVIEFKESGEFVVEE